VLDWRHVPSAQNPADEASRGMNPRAMLRSGMWQNGPSFLNLEPNKWPSVLDKKSPDSMNCYTRFDLKRPAVVGLVSSDNGEFEVDRLINYFSSYYRLKLACAWMLRYKRFLQNRLNSVKLEKSRITVTELHDAENALIKYVQHNYFQEYPAILKGKEIKISSKSDLYKLNPILVQEILRVGGRLNKACIAFEVAHPIILPEHCHLTELIISDCHERLAGHLGVGSTLNQVYHSCTAYC